MYYSTIINNKEYTIEPLLFGDYYVAVYDLNMNLLKPKKKFKNYNEAKNYFDKIIKEN
jgi:hypothetical protein